MQFEHSAKVQDLMTRLSAFMDEHVYPVEDEYREYFETTHGPERWEPWPKMAALKEKAREAGLWNLFMPHKEYGAGLTNLEYAPLCEIMGRVPWAPEIFNCSAPDTGNMEVFVNYATKEQQEKWLKPLLAGEIRSAFAMTEPDVASSDATNVRCSITRDGDEYVINGKKWFITGAPHTNCKIMIVMGKSDPDAPRHQQQSQILVPKDTPGVTIKRPLTVYGYDDAPHGHAEVHFEDVRVPAENILLGEGRGFEIAQGRLGPGRIHHCMRLIGVAQRALETACVRVENRETFGRKVSQHQSIREELAKSYCEIEQARLLTLKAADAMDRFGNKKALSMIAAIKIVAPTMACTVIDRAMQMHGAGGLTGDYFMSEAFQYARTVRLADGPDEVHMMQLGRLLVNQYNS